MKQNLIILFFSINLFAQLLFAQKDVDGSKDHPLISRYPGSHIVYYNEQDYNEYSIATGPVTGYRQIDDWIVVEGKQTRIYYELEGNVSITQIYRNYLDALEKSGFEILAKGLHASSNIAKEVGGNSWMGTFYIKNPYPTNAKILMGHGTSSSGGSGTIAAKLEKNGGKSYIIFNGREHSNDKKIYVIDIIEETAMESDLITINADQMLKGIKAEGKIILYGIFFDLDKAEVKSESEPTLKEIANLLKNDPSLNLFVVGHTDMQGRFDYNIDLSKRRAAAVVKILTEKYGINNSRLTPDGVGPLVPASTNETEEGRKMNRRVELVGK
jgi:OmpA-OmpF porin, OOP family